MKWLCSEDTAEVEWGEQVYISPYLGTIDMLSSHLRDSDEKTEMSYDVIERMLPRTFTAQSTGLTLHISATHGNATHIS